MSDYTRDIEKYLKGELTPAERNALERKALHDPFLADALEGAEQINAEDFSKDVAELNERIANKKSVSVWMWPTRIAAGLAILAVCSFIVWIVMEPVETKELAMETAAPAPAITQLDSVNPSTGNLSSPPTEQPSSGPVSLDKDVATRSKQFKVESKPKPSQVETELVSKIAEDVAIAQAEQTKAEEIKTDEVRANEPAPQAQAAEKEVALARAKTEDDVARKKAISADKKKDLLDAAPATADKGFNYAPITAVKVIRGRITLTDNDTPLPGVNVVVKGTASGTATDAKGNYEIEVTKADPVLVYSFIGLKSTEVEVKEKTEINLQMSTDVAQLNEVVVTTGSGVERDRAVPPSSFVMASSEISDKEYQQYLEKNVRYPEQAKANKIEGRVTVQFTVEADGALTNFTVIRGIGNGCDEELIRLIKEGPKWNPTTREGAPIQDKVKVRLNFVLPK